MSSGLNNFVTESEIAEARKKRQEEWEKVRTAEEPERKFVVFDLLIQKLIIFRFLEVPEEAFDGRSLFERLKEQKYKKDLEFEEAHKLSAYILHVNLKFDLFFISQFLFRKHDKRSGRR